MSDAVLAAVAQLRTEQQALTEGLIMLNESVGALTEMVATLVGVSTQEPEGENATAKALTNLTQAVNRAGLQVGQLREAMTGATLRGALPPTSPA